jgi:hypothetical protein
MLNEVIRYLNNFFYRLTLGLTNFSFTRDLTFTASTNKVAGDFTDTFIVGEYVQILGSRLNDGIYLVKVITTTELTIDETVDLTFTDETEIECTITKLYIPNELVSLIADIKTYEATANNGVLREKQGSREVDYAGSSTWSSVFASRLNKYKKVRW